VRRSRAPSSRQPWARVAAVTALAAWLLAVLAIVRAAGDPPRPPRARLTPAPTPAGTERPARRNRPRPLPSIVWRDSLALGSPTAGRLVRAVQLPARGEHYLTWDPVFKRTPNRWTRRNATDDLVRVLLKVTSDFAAAHPAASRILIGDLSRPRGGDFGRRFGPLGHASHQNGLDADVYFPRRDRRERAARNPGQVDRAWAQEIVDRFVRAGARKIFVGARLGLRGPPGVVQPWPNHDDHLHLRLAPRGGP
jgi:murein endopeptidase